MAVPSFVGAGSGAAVGTGVLTVSKTGCTAGNLVVVQVLVLATTNSTIDAVTNAEDLAGTDSALTPAPSLHWTVGNPASARQAAYFGRVLSNGTVSVDVDSISGTAAMLGRVYEFSGVSAETTIGGILVNTESGSEVTQAANTGTTISNNDVTTDTADCLGLAFVVVAADQTIAAFSGETGGDWVEAVAEYTSASPAGAISLQTVEIPSAGTVANGTITISSAAWAADLTALLPFVAAVIPDLRVVSSGRRW